MGQAASGDTIKVAGGVYRENLEVIVSTVLTIEGGWSDDFSVRDPALTPTKVDGRGLGHVFHVVAYAGVTIALTLDGLVVTRGRDTLGGGILALTDHERLGRRSIAVRRGRACRRARRCRRLKIGRYAFSVANRQGRAPEADHPDRGSSHDDERDDRTSVHAIADTTVRHNGRAARSIPQSKC